MPYKEPTIAQHFVDVVFCDEDDGTLIYDVTVDYYVENGTYVDENLQFNVRDDYETDESIDRYVIKTKKLDADTKVFGYPHLGRLIFYNVTFKHVLLADCDAYRYVLHNCTFKNLAISNNLFLGDIVLTEEHRPLRRPYPNIFKDGRRVGHLLMKDPHAVIFTNDQLRDRLGLIY